LHYPYLFNLYNVATYIYETVPKPYKVDRISNNSVVYQKTFLARWSYLIQQETSCTSATTRYRSSV